MTRRSLFVLSIIAAVFISKAAYADDYSYRFLWPADESAPGADLVELSANEKDAGETGTPLGAAEVTEVSLAKGDETVAVSEVMKVKGRDDVVIISTTTKKGISSPTGEYGVPHFALPAVSADNSYEHVLDFVVEEFITPIRYAVPTTGPIVMYTDDLDVVIMSPLDNFMSAMQAPVKGEWRCGFGGMIEEVPAGTTAKTIIVTGKGINATFYKWGAIVQKWFGHEPVGPYADISLSHLGFWTDNGAYYYYNTEPDMNYHETLLAVKAYADAENIPYAYMQIDSWWYPKQMIDDRSSHGKGGFILWEPIPEMFPQGMPAFQEELGLPLVAHNRYCAENSPYCDKYGCVYSSPDEKKKGAYPTDPAFWDEIMDNAVDYGVVIYEQDWLYTHMDIIPWMREGLGNAESWYDNMANAAGERDLTMQLCMASPEFLMQQLKHDEETHVRTSHDYKGGLPKAYFWMPFHKAGLFAHSVGLWPFKDNFRSSTGQGAAYYWFLPEANPWEEALVAAMSGGPVGPSDMIGMSDRDLIMKTCRSDGLLLKPDRPATPIDIMFLINKHIGFGGKKPWVVTTESDHEIGRTTYLMAFNLWPQSMYQPWVTFEQSGLDGPHLVYNYQTGEAEVDDDRIGFGWMPPEKGFFYVLAPMLDNGMAVIGEVDKFATMSMKRFSSVRLEDGLLIMDVEGVPGESIRLAVFSESGIYDVTGAEVESEKDGLFVMKFTVPESGSHTVTAR